MKRKFNLLLLFACCVLMSQYSIGQNMYADLVGARGSSAETSLKNKGYHHIKTDRYGMNLYSYWWNSRNNTCICERIADGRVQSIVKSLPADCNKKDNGNVDRYHKSYGSYHHEYPNNYSNRDERAAYDAGFNDGRYNHSFYNHYSGNAKQAYNNGYVRGVQNRNSNTRYRDTHKSHGNVRGNYKGGYVDLHDLEGDRAKEAHKEIVDRRGFREIHSFEHNGNHRKIYHNSTTGQCVEAVFHGDYLHEIKHFNDCDKYL